MNRAKKRSLFYKLSPEAEIMFGIFLVLFALMTPVARAQIDVNISLKRSLYVAYEPILVTVTINNLTGNDLDLADTNTSKWFDLQLETLDGRPIPQIDPTYSNPPLQISAGQKISRTINLTPIFPVNEFGGYRLKATVFLAQAKKFFTSRSLNFEVTEGRLLWQKTVGVPDGMPRAGTTRSISMLSHRLPESNQLYIRIEDKDAGIVYCNHQLGRFLSFTNSNILLDQQNRIHILQNTAPKSFVYSLIGLNGEVMERKSYTELSSRPGLRRGSDGSVVIVGGQVYDPAESLAEQSLPSLSDRPVSLPGPEKKSTPEEKRPENLLSR